MTAPALTARDHRRGVAREHRVGTAKLAGGADLRGEGRGLAPRDRGRTGKQDARAPRADARARELATPLELSGAHEGAHGA